MFTAEDFEPGALEFRGADYSKKDAKSWGGKFLTTEEAAKLANEKLKNKIFETDVTRKITQITAIPSADGNYTALYALCSDQTLWVYLHKTWAQIPTAEVIDKKVYVGTRGT